MKATIISSVIGILGFDNEGKNICNILFPKDAEKIAVKLLDIESGKIINEITTLVKELKDKGFSTFIFENPELSKIVQKEFCIKTEIKPSTEIGEDLRKDLVKYAVKLGYINKSREISKLIHSVSIEMSKIKVGRATEKRDLLIVQAIQTLEDLDKNLNLFMGRIREWYGLHFPEMDRIIDKHEEYARIVNKLGKRENFSSDNLIREKVLPDKISKLVKAANSSMGAHMYNKDVIQIQTFCERIIDLYHERDILEKYIEGLMEEVAPNTFALVGATLGAKFIAIAGGLENLAKKPASTIQVLGAEKALFRSLTTGARPPKHGIIFQHTLIHGSKRWLRGKIARIFAGRLAIAIRTDAFSNKYIGDVLKEDLKKRIREIEKKKVKPKLKSNQPYKSHFKVKRRKKYGRKG